MPIGVEQWRASIGLYRSGSHKQLACVSAERQLPPIPIYHLHVVVLVLILMVFGTLLVIWILVNGYFLFKEGLTRIMAFKKRTSGTQLLVSMCTIGQAVMETISSSLERAVRAMAILLIMAGDIEENPGPIVVSTSDTRPLGQKNLRTVSKYLSDISKSDLESLGLALGLYLPTMDNYGSKVTMAQFCRYLIRDWIIGKDSVTEYGEATWSTLINALREERQNGIANKIKVEQIQAPAVSKYLIDLNDLSDLHSLGLALGLYQKTMKDYMKPDDDHEGRHRDVADFRYYLICDWLREKDDVTKYGGATWSSLVATLKDLQLMKDKKAKKDKKDKKKKSYHDIATEIESEQIKGHQEEADERGRTPKSTPPVERDQSPSPSTKQAKCSPPPPIKQAKCSPAPPMKQVECSPSPPTKQVECSPPPAPFLFFISFLRDFYNSEVPLSYCKWPPVPKKKFVNLAAISKKGVSSKELRQFMLASLHGHVDQILKEKSPIKLEAILEHKPEEKLRVHCVLIEGAPGMGKTTLSWEICKRWARGELFQQYTVVMLLRLKDRTVQNAESIMDLVYYMFDDEDEGSRKIISQHMKNIRGKHTLIILEGLDELPKQLLNMDQPSIFTRLLSRKILPNATILITSRPSATVQLCKGWEIFRHIEILGFTDKDITDYIQTTLSAQELTAFDNYLSVYPNIRLAMYIPLNCAIVIAVYISCQQSRQPPPKTTTELYTRLVQTILLRYLESHPDYKDCTTGVDKFTDLPPPVYQHFCSIIEMAYDGVLSQQLTFHDKDHTIEHLGLMHTETELFPNKPSATYSFNFLHLSLQEYLAAYHASTKGIDKQQQLLQTLCTDKHLNNMGQYLAGITKFKKMNRDTVKAIIERECVKGRDGTLTLSPYTLLLLHESGDYSIIDGYSSYSCTLTDYSPLLDFAVLGHCIANSSYKWTLNLGKHRQYMQSTDKIAMLVKTLMSHSNPSYTIDKINCFYDAPECAQHLLLELPQYCLQQIQTLWLVSNVPLPPVVYEHILSKMSSLHTLRLWHGAVSTTGATAIAGIIKSNNIMTLRLRLYRNTLSAEGRRALEEIREEREDLVLYITE